MPETVALLNFNKHVECYFSFIRFLLIFMKLKDHNIPDRL